MTTRRLYTEIIIIAAFCIAVVLVLSFSARSRVTFLHYPKYARIMEPQEAYRLWEENGIHGRILVYFGRGLPIDKTEHNAAIFIPAEFHFDDTSTALCHAIYADSYAVPAGAEQRCDDFLNNTVLGDRHFADRWLEKRKNSAELPAKIRGLIGISRGYKDDYALLNKQQKQQINTLNRLLLEITYPDLCPKSREYVLTDNNYAYVAAKRNLFRKIYHVVPDNAWSYGNIIERYFSGAQISPDSIRTPLLVPVIKLRLRNVRPLREAVVIAVRAKDWNSGELDEIKGLLQNNVLRSDLLTYETSAPPISQERTPVNQ